MPKLRMMRYGCSLSFTAGLSGRDMSETQKRNRHHNKGWTKAATRNLTNYLMLLDLERTPGTPYAFTLTIPAACMDRTGPDELHGLLAAWLRACRRRYGLEHYCWLIEFTAAGTPHIHLTAWCDESRTVYNRRTRRHETRSLPPIVTQTLMLAQWIALCEARGIPARMTGQLFRPMDATPEAWLAYNAKHATRGVMHYQRRLDAMHGEWRTIRGPCGDMTGCSPLSRPVMWTCR